VHSLTRRQLLVGGAGLGLARLLVGPAARAAHHGRTDANGVVEVTLLIPASAFRRRVRTGRFLYTPPLRSPHRLDVLGLSWQTPRDRRLELRTRQRGRWSDWWALRPAGDHGPDRGGRPRATDPVAVAARVFQLRATAPPGGLQAHGVAVAVRNRAAAFRAVPAASAVAPAVIPRSDWGAQTPRTPPEHGEVQLAFVHHTVSTNDYGPEDSFAIVRAIQHYHRNVLGWNDIGYQLLVDRHGQVFEGRAGGIDQAVVGAQAQGYNSVSTGVATIGTHTSESLGSAASEALAAVLAWKLSLHGVPTAGQVIVTSAGGPLNRFPAGRRVLLERISGHRDGDATACPGEALYAQLPALRARAGELAAATGLSLTVDPRRVDQLEPATASGLLLQPDGAPAVGVAVEVQAATARGWETIATSVSDPTGAWSAAVNIPHSRALRAFASIDVASAPLVSPRVRLEVRSRISAEIRPQRLRFGRRTVVVGAVEPRRPVRRLIVTVERRVAGGRYLRVARFRTQARRGRFRVALLPSRPGLYRVRIAAPADRLNAASRSGWLFARALR
jgi:hypothetical protein